MQIELLCKSHSQMSGLARYAGALLRELKRMGQPVHHVAPCLPPLLRSAPSIGRLVNIDIATFLQTFPLAAQFKKQRAVRHLTSQEMGTLLLSGQQMGPTVVTVHDILPHLLRADSHLSELTHPASRLFYRLAMRGLKRATHLIADSAFTKTSLVTALGIPAKRITVIPLAIDHTVFRPNPPPAAFWQQFDLPPNKRIILYVGSDAPRKNLPRLLTAFQQVRKQIDDVLLVKVGSSTSHARHTALLQAIEQRQLQTAVRIFTNVSAEMLPHFYNAAAVFAFPSRYEGFGLPPLEAMACGLPVVCSNATSLPEVVGDAAQLVNPTDPQAIANAIYHLLTNSADAKQLRRCGLARAKQFTWRRTAEQTLRVYQQLQPNV